MVKYTLLLLHKLEESFGYYDVQTGQQLAKIKTNPFPHEICLDTQRSKIYIAEMGVRGIESKGPGGHTISVFDLRTHVPLRIIDTGKYDRPHGIVASTNKLLVTSESTRKLLVFDLASEKLIKAIHLGQDCAHMVNISPDGLTAYTANILSNSISVVDIESYKLIKNIKVPERPEGMVFSSDGNLLYCVCREAKSLVIIDTSSFTIIDSIETKAGPVRVAISPDGKQLCVPLFHSAAVQFVDTVTRKITKTIQIGPHPAGTCISPDGKLAFISCEDESIVFVIKLDTYEISTRIKTGAGADAMICLFASETE